MIMTIIPMTMMITHKDEVHQKQKQNQTQKQKQKQKQTQKQKQKIIF